MVFLNAEQKFLNDSEASKHTHIHTPYTYTQSLQQKKRETILNITSYQNSSG